jgi:uncharacterized SAM-binding protein YcdF (DUF218 family)
MLLLSTRLAFSRFLDPLLLILVALGVLLYLAFRDTGAQAAVGRRARAGAWATWGALWLLSTPVVTNGLCACTETRGPDLGVALAGKDLSKAALVVLGAGLRTRDQSSPPRERLDAAGTQRALTASRLWHERGFGLVVLSGAPPEEGEAMRDLVVSMGVPPERVVVEERSLNTRENAAFSAAILREKGVETVVVATSATHLRRAVKDFAAVGMKVVPAAAEIIGLPPLGVDGLLPSAFALARTHVCLHEILGYVRG